MRRSDPRTRLLLGILAVAAVLLTRRQETLLVESVAILAAAVFTRQTSAWLRSLRLIGPMAALVMLLGVFFYGTTEAIFLALRIFNLFSVSFLCFQAVKPQEWDAALRKLHVPYTFSFILTTGLRYVPLMGRNMRRIMDAQTARGVDLSFRLRNAANLLALIVPLLLQCFLLAEQLAMAMESRGFGSPVRTSRKQLRFSTWDSLLILSGFAAFAGIVWWERFHT